MKFSIILKLYIACSVLNAICSIVTYRPYIVTMNKYETKPGEKINVIRHKKQNFNEKYPRFKNLEIGGFTKDISAISSQQSQSKLECVETCSVVNNCSLISYTSDKKCYLYDADAMNHLKKSDNKTNADNFYMKTRSNNEIGTENNHVSGLIHHWPLGESLDDIVGGKNITLKINGQIGANRFNESYSALKLNEGYGEFPPGKYFEPSGYTFMIWVLASGLKNHQRIFEFGNGHDNDNVGIGYHGGETTSVIQFKSGNYSCSHQNMIELNKWIHYAVSVGQSSSYFYVNGVEINSCPNFPTNLRSIERSKNFIGGTAWSHNTYSFFNGKLDDLKIFNRQLSAQEIVEEKDNTGSKVYGHLLYIFISLKLFTEGLVHYWPMAGSTNDLIGSKHMTIVKGYLTTDKFGNKKSAVAFNQGYGTLPTGSYFKSSDFTIMAWVKLLIPINDQNIFVFNNDVETRVIFIEIYGMTGAITYFYSGSQYTTSPIVLLIGTWAHVAITKEGDDYSLFVDSNKISSRTVSGTLHQIETNFNRIGGRNTKPGHQVIDELKIFNRALTVEEISVEKNRAQPYNIEQI